MLQVLRYIFYTSLRVTANWRKISTVQTIWPIMDPESELIVILGDSKCAMGSCSCQVIKADSVRYTYQLTGSMPILVFWAVAWKLLWDERPNGSQWNSSFEQNWKSKVLFYPRGNSRDLCIKRTPWL